MVLIIDNYDSFTYNLVQLVGGITPDIRVARNDVLTVEEVCALVPTHIILSPGPGYPKDAGVCEGVVKKLAGECPILGVCLGHQAICEAFGAVVAHAARLMHGKKSLVNIDNQSPIFRGLPPQIEAARYHSLAAKRRTLPDALEVLATDEQGEIMAVGHRDYPVYGLQFHPESILTPNGGEIMRNFLTL